MAFKKFAADVGCKARSEWADKKNVPTDLNEISGLVRSLHSQDGRNQQLKKWAAYRNWNYASVKDSLELIKACRDTLNHEPRGLSAEMVCDLLKSTCRVLEELTMDKVCLEQQLEFMKTRFLICADGDRIPVIVSREVDSAAVHMQIGFSAQKLVGRDQLIAAVTTDILGRVKRGEHSRTVLAGQSGVGKTVLAREICNKLLEALPVQVMLLGTSSGTLRMELARLGRNFTPGLPEQADEAQAFEAARRFLSITGYVLFVDDAVDLDELWSLLPIDSAGGQAGHVIFTTQQPDGWARASLLTSYKVGLLSTDESLEVLKSSGRDDMRMKKELLQDESIDLRGFVSRELGNLPLAVSMLKSVLQGLDVHQGREVMVRLRQNVASELGGYHECKWYVRTLKGLVRELIEVRLWRRCRENGVIYSTATMLLSMICVLDANGAPDELMAAASDSADTFASCIAALADAGLVNSDRLNGLSSMHTLYRTCIFHYFQKGLGRDVSLISWGYIWRSLESQFIKLARDSRANARGLLRLYGSARCVAHCKGDKPVEQDLCFIQLAESHKARLLSAVGMVGMVLVHDWKDAELFLNTSHEINVAELGPDHPDVAANLNDLASLHLTTGHYKQALPLLERTLSIIKATHDADQPSVAASLNNLAFLHQNMGQYRLALPLFEQALSIMEATLDSDHQATVAACLNNLASLHSAMGQHELALPLQKQALAIRETTLGHDHPDVAQSLCNLASLHQTMDEHTRALPLFERSLKIREVALGLNHPDVAVSLSNLASLHKATGQHDEALPLYERALAIREAVLGSDHPDVAASLQSLASLHRAMDQNKQALPLYERALEINETMLGPEHPAVASSLGCLASLHRVMGQYEQALPLYERALAIRMNSLGPDHPDVANSLTCIALLHQTRGHYQLALPLMEQALRIDEAIFGLSNCQVSTI
jgi:tetratricopeptide (TPR) repeat protein